MSEVDYTQEKIQDAIFINTHADVACLPDYISHSINIPVDKYHEFDVCKFVLALYHNMKERGVKGMSIFVSSGNKLSYCAICEKDIHSKSRKWLDLFYREPRIGQSEIALFNLANTESMFYEMSNDFKNGVDITFVEDEIKSKSYKFLVENKMITPSEDEGDDPSDYNEYYENLGLELIN